MWLPGGSQGPLVALLAQRFGIGMEFAKPYKAMNSKNKQQTEKQLKLLHWRWINLAQFEGYEDYAVACTSNPKRDYQKGKTRHTGFGKFESYWDAVSAITSCESMKDFIDAGYLRIDELISLKLPNGQESLHEYASGLDIKSKWVLYGFLQDVLSQQYMLTIEREYDGFYVYYDGLLAYRGHDLNDAIINAYLFGGLDTKYLLAVPYTSIRQIYEEDRLEPPKPHLIKVDRGRKAFVIELE